MAPPPRRSDARWSCSPSSRSGLPGPPTPTSRPEPFVGVRCIRDAANAFPKAADLLDRAADRVESDKGEEGVGGAAR